MRIREWQTIVHMLAKEKGWYETERTPLEYHMLIVSEVAEATEAVRSGQPPTNTGKPEGEMIELADAVIRIMDYFEYRGFDLEGAIRTKHEYNKTRPHRHGGKKV